MKLTERFRFHEVILELIHTAFAVTAVHEMCHLVATYALGGAGYIFFNHTYFTQTPANPIPVYFAGGLGTALIYLLDLYGEEDPEDAVVLKFIIIQQTIYGLFEGVWAMTGWTTPWLLGVGANVGLIFLLLFLIRALKKNEDNVSL